MINPKLQLKILSHTVDVNQKNHNVWRPATSSGADEKEHANKNVSILTTVCPRHKPSSSFRDSRGVWVSLSLNDKKTLCGRVYVAIPGRQSFRSNTTWAKGTRNDPSAFSLSPSQSDKIQLVCTFGVAIPERQKEKVFDPIRHGPKDFSL